MKKIMTLAVAMATAVVCFANGDVQPTAEPTDNILGTEVSAPLSGTCKVKVYWRSNGKNYPYKDCKIRGYNTDGFCKDVYTNSDGEATLTWVGSGDLLAIYINGKEHEGKYTDGGSYTFYVED